MKFSKCNHFDATCQAISKQHVGTAFNRIELTLGGRGPPNVGDSIGNHVKSHIEPIFMLETKLGTKWGNINPHNVVDHLDNHVDPFGNPVGNYIDHVFLPLLNSQ